MPAVARGLRSAHPRVCGENRSPRIDVSTVRGSSPRVRGKPGLSFFNSGEYWLIPACAGKTFLPSPEDHQTWAHPRVCGENQLVLHAIILSCGSSPRVRGKRRLSEVRDGISGLIPACAGKTIVAARKASARRAHPRVCGENLECLLATIECLGSSPRVRGKRCTPIPDGRSAGLIPACAGKTRRRCARARARWAHPRVCGENLK